jgi:intracellular multiplication protein IcmK
MKKFIIILFCMLPWRGVLGAEPGNSGQSLEELQQLVARAMGIEQPGIGQAQNLSAAAANIRFPGDAAGSSIGQSAQEIQRAVLEQSNNIIQSQSGATTNLPAAGVVNTAGPSTPPTPPQPSPYDKAFGNAVTQIFPMTKEQIIKLREVHDASQFAAAIPAGIPPRPTATSLQINLSPGATPPVIRLGAGYISSLVFVDATGQAWPIDSYSVGDPSAFNIQWDQKGNTMLVQSLTQYKRSNMAVILKELSTPVMVTLISGQEALDYRVDLRIPKFGPNAVFSRSSIPDAADPLLLDILNGIAPDGSKELVVKGGECQAWSMKNTLYLRTKLSLLSPGWKAKMSSIDGTHAYQLQLVPIILATQHGRDKRITLTLEGL